MSNDNEATPATTPETNPTTSEAAPAPAPAAAPKANKRKAKKAAAADNETSDPRGVKVNRFGVDMWMKV